jgi:hypothetical protein
MLYTIKPNVWNSRARFSVSGHKFFSCAGCVETCSNKFGMVVGSIVDYILVVLLEYGVVICRVKS